MTSRTPRPSAAPARFALFTLPLCQAARLDSTHDVAPVPAVAGVISGQLRRETVLAASRTYFCASSAPFDTAFCASSAPFDTASRALPYTSRPRSANSPAASVARRYCSDAAVSYTHLTLPTNREV